MQNRRTPFTALPLFPPSTSWPRSLAISYKGESCNGEPAKSDLPELDIFKSYQFKVEKTLTFFSTVPIRSNRKPNLLTPHPFLSVASLI